MRELLAAERKNADRRANLAIEVFCYSAKKYIVAYLAAMNGADAIVFSGGVGKNSPDVRARICRELGWFWIAVDDGKNALDAAAGFSIALICDARRTPISFGKGDFVTMTVHVAVR